MQIDVINANEFFLDEVTSQNLDFFSKVEYIHSLGKNPESSFYFKSDEYLLLVLIEKKYFFTYASFVSEIQQIGPATGDQQIFIEEVCRLLRDRFKVDWISSTNSHSLFAVYPKKNCIAIPFGSYILKLDATEEELFSKMHSKHRNVVRRAIKEEVHIVLGGVELLHDYCKVDAQTWARSNMSPRGYEYYRNFVENNKSVVVALAYNNEGVPQAGAIVPYSKKRAVYLHGCSADKSILGSANLLQWEIIKYLKEKKIESYDFAGCRIDADSDSKYYNIQRFKERFGGELHYGFMFKVIFNPLKYKLFKKLIQIRDKKEFKDIIDQEENKWKEKDINIYRNNK